MGLLTASTRRRAAESGGRSWVRWIGAVALGFFALAPASARGDDGASAAMKREARALANEGHALFKQGKYQRAVEAFSEADRRFHAPTILFMLGQSYERLGRLVEATEAYRQVLEEKLPRRAPAAFVAAQKRSKARLGALAGRIPSLRITVTGAPPADVQVTIDGLSATLPRDGAPMPQDPGQHTIAAAAAGYQPETRVITLVEGERQDVTLELVPVAVRRPLDARRRATPARDAPDAPASSGAPAVAIVALTVGAVGIGLGAVTGALTLVKANELKKLCRPPSCDGSSVDQFEKAADLQQTADTTSTIANVSLVVGGVATAAGLVLLVLRPGSNDAAPQTGVLLGPGWVGVAGVF